MEQRYVVERFIEEHFPAADIAVVAGSTARGNRTHTSDIDLLLVGEDVFRGSRFSEDPPGENRQGLAGGFDFGDEFFEVFAYTPQGYEEWADRGLAQFRPVIVHMLLEGVEVRGGEALAELRIRWARALAAGPVVDVQALDLRRYIITDQLDDLRDSRDPLEQAVIAALLFERIAELMLLAERHWIGAGKYLPRRVRELSMERTDALAQPLLARDFETFATRVEHELDRAGGRVQTGFVR